MHEGPRIKKFPIAIQFLGTYVIVMGVTSLWIYKKCNLTDRKWCIRAHRAWAQVDSKITSKGMDVEVLVEITERGF